MTNEQGLDQTQGSIRHLQEADAVIAMRQYDLPLPNEDATLLQFKSLKMRQHKRSGGSQLVEAYLGKMQITDIYHELSEWTQKSDDDGGMNMNYDQSTKKSTDSGS